MSISATTIAKIAATLAKDKRVQKIIVTIGGIVLGIIILIVGCFFTICDSLSFGNLNTFSWILGGVNTEIVINAPTEIKYEMTTAINNIKASFEKLDTAIEEVNNRITNKSLDTTWIKSIFYTLYFEKDQPEDDFYEKFINCFIINKTIDDVETEEPLTDKKVLLDKLNNDLQLQVTQETLSTADEYYTQIKSIKFIK